MTDPTYREADPPPAEPCARCAARWRGPGEARAWLALLVPGVLACGSALAAGQDVETLAAWALGVGAALTGIRVAFYVLDNA